MHPKTVKKILEDEEQLDLAQMAGAILEEKKHEPKKKHIPSLKRSLQAYRNLQAKEQAKVAWREKVKKVWPKQNPP